MTEKLAFEGLTIQEASASISLEGPMDGLTHSGELVVGSLATTALKPLTLELKWNGRGESIERFDIVGDNETSRFEISGTSVWEEVKVG